MSRPSTQLTPEQMKDLMDKLKLKPYPISMEEARKKDSKFWLNKPVPKYDDKIFTYGKIKDLGQSEDIATNLPNGFKWDTNFDIDSTVLFLNKYYGYPTDSFMPYFTIDYINLISLDNPITLTIRAEKNGAIACFMMGTPINMITGKEQAKVLNIKLMCLHPKLRNKNMINLCMNEFTRIAGKQGYEHGFFSGKRYVKKPFCETMVYNRAISVSTLIKHDFIKLGKDVTKESMRKALVLPEKPIPNFVPMLEEHMEKAYALFNKYSNRYTVYPVYTFDQFKQLFKNKSVTSYVLLENDEVIDFISYYEQGVRAVKTNKIISTAHLFYYTSNIETVYQLIKNMIIVAKNKGMNLFCMYDIMENSDIISDLKFEKSNNITYYNFYNWNCPELNKNQIGFIPV